MLPSKNFPSSFIKNHSVLIWILFTVLLTTSSCLKYQYVTLTSNIPSTDIHPFSNMKDSIEVIYSFYGDNGLVSIKVFNQNNSSVYIDWSKCSFIIGNANIPFWTNQGNISTSTTTFGLATENQFFAGSSSTNGYFYKEDQIKFIPPKSTVSIVPYFLTTEFIQLSDSIKKKRGKKINFKKEDAPLKFRSYLTIYTKENSSKPLVFENKFWVSAITFSDLVPTTVFNKQENNFYISELSTYGQIIGTTGVILGTTILILASLAD